MRKFVLSLTVLGGFGTAASADPILTFSPFLTLGAHAAASDATPTDRSFVTGTIGSGDHDYDDFIVSSETRPMRRPAADVIAPRRVALRTEEPTRRITRFPWTTGVFQ